MSTDRKKMLDKDQWNRMGLELRFMQYMAIKISCDTDYNAMMDKKTWGVLFKVIDKISDLRSDCEDRMFKFTG